MTVTAFPPSFSFSVSALSAPDACALYTASFSFHLKRVVGKITDFLQWDFPDGFPAFIVPFLLCAEQVSG
jgi:hypothetical protein